MLVGGNSISFPQPFPECLTSLILAEFSFPKMHKKKDFKARKKRNSIKIQSAQSNPSDGMPWNRWYYNMRTAQLTDLSILARVGRLAHQQRGVY